jgi:2'-5' RNA ligase
MKLINKMKSFVEFFTERTNLSKGCAMVYFDFPDMKEIHSLIDEKDIYKPADYGLDKEPHCTLLYGFDPNVKGEAVFDTIKQFKIPKFILQKASLFENEYDVLKFDVLDTTKTLHKINKKLCKSFPYESDFPTYHPHCTVAYLKKGTGKKYVDLLKGKKYTVTPKYIVYSFDGDKEKRKP